MEIKKVAIFAGTFDPITLGHIDIIKQALKSFKEVIILVAINEKKKPTYSLKERVKFIKLSTKGMKVKVDYTSGLTVNYAKKHHVNYLIRGYRNKVDHEYEKKMCEFNKKLNPDITTLIYKGKKSYQNISSSKVKEEKKKGRDLSSFVSNNIVKYL